MLKTVTVTGADESISPWELVPIAEQYPFVEFGILANGSLASRSRFPAAKAWIEDLHIVKERHGLKLASHLCGRLAREFLVGEHVPIDFALYGRYQINTHGVLHPFDHAKLRSTVNFLTRGGSQVIFQGDDVNTRAMLACRGPSPHCDHHSNRDLDVAVLFDLSHGGGVLPDTWPAPLDGIPCGYAGGLSPENVSGQIVEILKAAGDVDSWIDAETYLRSPDDLVFDLGKVRRFLDAASPHVRKA
jgi:hypothetical protein